MSISLNKKEADAPVSPKGIYTIYCLFAVVYTFMKWGFWWGILNMFIPFSPFVDLVKHITK